MFGKLALTFKTARPWRRLTLCGMSLLSLLILAFLLGIFVEPSFAQEPAIPWLENLDCDRAVQKFRGVEYCTGMDGNAHVIVVDLHEPGVRLEYIIAEGVDRDGVGPSECKDVNRWQKTNFAPGCNDPANPEYYPVMSLVDAVRRNGDTAAVIDSDYGARTLGGDESRDHGPEGFTVVRGNRIDGPAMEDGDNNAERRPWLAIGEDSPLRAEFGQFPSGADDGSKPSWVYTGVGGAPWLIRDGEIDSDEISTCKNAEPHSCNSPVAQTAYALSQDGRWLYLLSVVGQNAQGTAQFLKEQIIPWQAIKVDGGGSSQLWWGGLPADNLEDKVVLPGDRRSLSQYLAVIAEPGSGIVFEPSLDRILIPSDGTLVESNITLEDCELNPVAITVTLISSVSFSSTTAPKMILASSPASS